MHDANCGRRIPLLICLFAVLRPGCETINLTIEDPPEYDSTVWIAVAELQSIEEIDKALSDGLDGPNAQSQCDSLISGWGKHGSWYDLIVVKFIWEHWASAYGEDHPLNYERVMKLIQARVSEQPELSNQVCWYVHWKHGPWTFARLTRWLQAQMIHGRYAEGEEFPRILYVAGLTGTEYDRHSVLAAEWDRLHLFLEFAKLTFLSNRPFLKYDARTGRFVLDASAEKQSKYVNVEQQNMTPRETPLPKWTGPIPAKKKDVQ